jgi:hypothetical protein
VYPSQKADLVEERPDTAQSRIDPQSQTAPRADCSGRRDGSRTARCNAFILPPTSLCRTMTYGSFCAKAIRIGFHIEISRVSPTMHAFLNVVS